MIFVGSSSNASGHRRIYVRHEVRKAFPLEQSLSKSGGRDGRKEIFFRLAVEVGIGEGARQVGSHRGGKAGLVLESPVRSGYLGPLGSNQDRDRLGFVPKPKIT